MFCTHKHVFCTRRKLEYQGKIKFFPCMCSPKVGYRNNSQDVKTRTQYGRLLTDNAVH